MAAIVCSYKYDTALSLYIADMSAQYNGNRIATFTLTDKDGNEHRKQSAKFGGNVTAGGDVTVFELTPGTYYEITAEIADYDSGAHLATVSGYGATTFPTNPIITYQKNESSAIISVVLGEGNADGVRVKIYDESGAVIKETSGMGGGTLSFNITNLSSGTTYTIEAYAFLLINGEEYANSDGYTETVSFTTDGIVAGDDEFDVTSFFADQQTLGDTQIFIGIEGDNLKKASFVVYDKDTSEILTKGVFTENGWGGYIYVNEFKTYNLQVKVSRAGKTITKNTSVRVSENYLQNVKYKRINQGLILDWEIIGPKDYDTHIYWINGYREGGKLNEQYKQFWDSFSYELDSMACAAVYTVSLSVNGRDIDDEESEVIGSYEEKITTAPSCPTLVSVSKNGEMLDVLWELECPNVNDVKLRVNICRDDEIINSYDFTVNAGEFSGAEQISAKELTNGTYTVKIATHYENIWCVDESGNGFSKETKFTIDASRPDDFYWTYPKVSKNTAYVTAEEWKRLMDCIDEFRVYCGFEAYPWQTIPISGDNLTAKIYNEALMALSDLPCSVEILNVQKGQELEANLLNLFEETINSIN